MAKDPGFIFYPGDYLRDTQCLSEKAQVAYDRIMCEHMRNICISQKQLDFFTKRLSIEEKEEIEMILTRVKCGFQIHWVAESISKRRAYSESRRRNRENKTPEHMKTYLEDMDNGNEIENEKVNGFKKPTIQEIKEYMAELGKPNEADAFFDHYQSNGWKVSKNPMKDWKAACRNWIRPKPFKAEPVGEKRQTLSDLERYKNL